MTKYRISITVEADNLPNAVVRLLYDEYAEPTKGLLALEVEEWD